jgi:hypothetical protein
LNHVNVLKARESKYCTQKEFCQGFRGSTVEGQRLKTTEQYYCAVAFLLGSDHIQFGKLIDDLENFHPQDQNNNPKTGPGCLHTSSDWKPDRRNMVQPSGAGGDGVVFTNNAIESEDSWKEGSEQGSHYMF